MPSDADADFDTLQRWRDGDRKAGDALVTEYYDHVRTFFTNAVSDDERQDLTNETFKRLMDAMQKFERRSSFRTFLFTIARNSLNDHLRRRYREQERGFDPLTHSVEDVERATPSRAVAELERYRQLVECLRALPVDTKQMLELYYWQDCTAEELADIYEIEPATIRTRVHAARQRLKKALADLVDKKSTGPRETEDDFERDLRAVGTLLRLGPVGI